MTLHSSGQEVLDPMGGIHRRHMMIPINWKLKVPLCTLGSANLIQGVIIMSWVIDLLIEKWATIIQYR